ncbi:hypothetical protein BC937DRAFT_93481 [Endogone sp. FLAS-F59071]|nr:hypothetical protein BC937DRAFT_93481 [Endogone sp. FLAS-F59071]|eukprot:RUS14684.1 hypothetical protein BC937DRAFT_93481 [Endogone sp. FLAS-F59071]
MNITLSPRPSSNEISELHLYLHLPYFSALSASKKKKTQTPFTPPPNSFIRSTFHCYINLVAPTPFSTRSGALDSSQRPSSPPPPYVNRLFTTSHRPQCPLRTSGNLNRLSAISSRSVICTIILTVSSPKVSISLNRYVVDRYTSHTPHPRHTHISVPRPASFR